MLINSNNIRLLSITHLPSIQQLLELSPKHDEIHTSPSSQIFHNQAGRHAEDIDTEVPAKLPEYYRVSTQTRRKPPGSTQ